MGSTNLHYQDGQERIKHGSISVEDMRELEKDRLIALLGWEAKEADYSSFQEWFDDVYTPNKFKKDVQ